jgi:hypothetical protein
VNERDFKFYLQWLSIRLWSVTGLAVRPQSLDCDGGGATIGGLCSETWFGTDAYVVTWKSLFEEPIMSMLWEPQSCQVAHHVIPWAGS